MVNEPSLIRVGPEQVNLSFAERVNEASGQVVQRCYYCQKCSAGCPTAFSMEYKPARMLRMVQLGLRDTVLTNAALWRCTGCDTCGVHCPNEISIGRVVETLRELVWRENYLVAEAPPIDETLQSGLRALSQLGERISTRHNISGEDNQGRLIWSQNLERIPEGLERKAGAEVLYFVGCVASFFPRTYRVPQSMTSIMEAAGIDFTTLGGEEWCCGYPLLSAGLGEQIEELAQHNVAQVKAIGVKKVVTACPSCYYMWKHVYGKLGGELDLEVQHSTEFLVELIESGTISLGELKQTVTYHDPCDLGRKSECYDPPRRVLESIPGLSFVEMADYRENALCCGGGGNLETFEPALVTEVALQRIGQARQVGAEVLVSACQQCERTFLNALRQDKTRGDKRLRVMDVSELVWRTMEKVRVEERTL